MVLLALAACDKDPSQMSDGELGLNPQQSHGRRVYIRYCFSCHPAYSSRGGKGPGLKDLYKKQYLPSGLIANDRFVEQSILHGRNMMPAFGDALSQRDLDDLIAYLHTL
jgi:mono/diheme cytochrome c family protein